MNTAGAVILAIVLLLIAAGVGWIIFTRIRASRLGLPPPPLRSYIPFLSSSASYGPTPAPGGVVGWVNDKIRLMRYRNKRTAAGAYEGASPSPYYGGGGGGQYGRGTNPAAATLPEDDDPWDSRLRGYNPYEEEDDEERQRGAAHGPGGEGYQMNLPVPAGPEGGIPPAAGGGAQQEPGRARTGNNPFGDDADPSNLSMRDPSPRPSTTQGPNTATAAAASATRDDRDRTSVFREDV